MSDNLTKIINAEREMSRSLRAENARLQAENERLRAIVDKLPKTADGSCHEADECRCSQCRQPGDISFDDGKPYVQWHCDFPEKCQCYACRLSRMHNCGHKDERREGMLVSMKLTKPQLVLEGKEEIPTEAVLPPGCVGVLYVWESKKAGRAWLGSGVLFTEIKISKQE